MSTCSSVLTPWRRPRRQRPLPPRLQRVLRPRRPRHPETRHHSRREEVPMSDDAASQETIDALIAENRTFPPPEHIKRDALVAGTDLYDEAAADDEGFWARQAADLAEWNTRVGHDLRVGAAVRQVVRRRPAQRVAQLPRPPRRGRTRRQGRRSTGRASPATPGRSPTPSCSTRCSASPTRSKGLGVQKGDRVNIYLPMIPEAAVAMLACARIGAAAQRRVRRVLAPRRSRTASTTPRPRC